MKMVHSPRDADDNSPPPNAAVSEQAPLTPQFGAGGEFERNALTSRAPVRSVAGTGGTTAAGTSATSAPQTSAGSADVPSWIGSLNDAVIKADITSAAAGGASRLVEVGSHQIDPVEALVGRVVPILGRLSIGRILATGGIRGIPCQKDPA